MNAEFQEGVFNKYPKIMLLLIIFSVISTPVVEFYKYKMSAEDKKHIEEEILKIDSGYSGHFVVDKNTHKPIVFNFYAEEKQLVLLTFKSSFLSPNFMERDKKNLEIKIDGDIYKQGIIPTKDDLIEHDITNSLLFENRNLKGLYHTLAISWNSLKENEKLIINIIAVVNSQSKDM